jgi:hypothetical protein
MDSIRSNNTHINLDINNEKVGNNSIVLKTLNNPNMNNSKNNLNTSTVSMKDKLKNPQNMNNEKKFNDTEENLISPSENFPKLDLNQKLSNNEQNTLYNPALNVENYQQNAKEDISLTNLRQNEEKSPKNLEENKQRNSEFTNNSLYSFNSNDINITNSINEAPRQENYFNSSNLDSSINDKKRPSDNNKNNNKNNSQILNKSKNENNKYNISANENNDRSRSSQMNYNNKEVNTSTPLNINLNFYRDIHEGELCLLETQTPLKGHLKPYMNDHINASTPLQTPLNVNLKNYKDNHEDNITPLELQTPLNGHLKPYMNDHINACTPLQTPLNVNLKSYLDKQPISECDLDENDIVLLNEDINNSKNRNYNPNNDYNQNFNFSLGKKDEKEGKLLLPKDYHNYLHNKSESVYEDAQSESDNFTQNTKENFKSNHIEFPNNFNPNPAAHMGAYGNFIRNKSIDESSILTENEVSMQSNNKYFTLKKNNKFSDVNNSYTNNQKKSEEPLITYPNSRRVISEVDNPNKSNTNYSIDQSSYIVTKNPVGAAYYVNKNNEKINLIQAEEEVVEYEQPNLNEKTMEKESEIRSNFFSPNTQTPLYITDKNNYNFNSHNFQNFNLNEEEIIPTDKTNNYNDFNQNKNTNTMNLNTNNNNFNFNTHDFITDMDDYNNNNFKSLLETEHSKIDTNTKPQNNYTSNSECKRKESEINNNNLNNNTNPYKRNVRNSNKENINKSTISNIEDRKIKTIFDRIKGNNDEEKKLNYTATNINIDDLKQIINDSNFNGNGKIIINQANITNSYNIKISNNNPDFPINENIFKDVNSSPIMKNKNISTEKEMEKEMEKELEKEMEREMEREMKKEKEIKDENKFMEIHRPVENMDIELVCEEAPEDNNQNLIPFEIENNNDNQKNELQAKISDLYSEKESKANSEITYKAKEQDLKNDNIIKLNNAHSIKLETIKKVDEPLIQVEDKIFEDNQENKNYIVLKTVNSNQPFKIDDDTLTKIHGENFIKEWKNKAVTKISYHVKISEIVKYFENNEINQKDFLNNIPDTLIDYKESLNEFLDEMKKECKIYDDEFIYDTKRKLELFKLDNNKINNSEKEELINLLNSSKPLENNFEKISNLYDIEILEQKYTLNNENQRFLIDNEFIIPFKSKANEEKLNSKKISYWRESLCDGNSFYRMFMFSLMERYIYALDFIEMAKLFKKIEKDYNEISKYNENLKPENKIETEKIFRNININNVLIIFNQILDAVIKDNKFKAYKILINAFNLEDDSFDRVN